MGTGYFFLFQRNYITYGNGYGGRIWTLSASSKGCDLLIAFQEYIDPVSSEDLYVISVFHGVSFYYCVRRDFLIVLAVF